MKMTLDILNEPCVCYPKRIEFAKKNKLIGLEDIDFIKKLIELDKLNWANWFIITILYEKNQFNYIIFAIDQFIDIYEKEYPSDDRPKEALKSIKAWIKNQSDETIELLNIAESDIKNIMIDSATWNIELKILLYILWNTMLYTVSNLTKKINTPVNMALSVLRSKAYGLILDMSKNTDVSKNIDEIENKLKLADESVNIIYNKILKKIINNGIEILKGEKNENN